MENAVVIDHAGKVFKGDYDGYGRVDGASIHTPADGREPCAWHLRCWENAGSPKEYAPSAYAEDQGYFFDEGAHDLKLPRKKPPAPKIKRSRRERDALRDSDRRAGFRD